MSCLARDFKDRTYFNAYNKAAILHILEKRELDGTLLDWMSRVAPDYVRAGTVLKFTLIADLEL